MSPITGIGHRGLPWQETLVTIGFMTVGIAIFSASILLLFSLRKSAAY
jgi:(hydroxyamino)benzene mutase